MPDNQLITRLELAFRERGFVKTSKEFADLIGENANGLSDIKAGRKRLAFDHIASLKKSHPNLNLDSVFAGDGELFSVEEVREVPDGIVSELRQAIIELTRANSQLTQANLVNAQTISQLLSREVVKEA